MLTTQLQPAADFSSPKTSQAGFLVLSMSKRILHINRSASALLLSLSGKDVLASGHDGISSLPEILSDVFHAILAELEKRIAGEDWRQFEMRTLFPSSQGLLLARGIGIPDPTRRQQSRIVIMLQHDPL
jgi:hypothetical protein